jgi:tRNA A22 N-methylase
MNRIDEIINQVTKKECVVADIGSDHAFVALKLLDKGFVKTIYNVEINEIPLQNSINNTAAYLKTGKVKNVINDGLKD